MQNSKTATPVLPVIDSVVDNRKAAYRFTKVGAMATHGGICSEQRKAKSHQGQRARLAQRCSGESSARAGLLKLREAMHTSFMDIACEFLCCVLVELQAFSAVDFGIRLLEPYAKGCQIAVVLFNQPVHGFLNKRIGVIIIAPRDFFADPLLEVGRQSDVHSPRVTPKVDRRSGASTFQLEHVAQSADHYFNQEPTR